MELFEKHIQDSLNQEFESLLYPPELSFLPFHADDLAHLLTPPPDGLLSLPESPNTFDEPSSGRQHQVYQEHQEQHILGYQQEEEEENIDNLYILHDPQQDAILGLSSESRRELELRIEQYYTENIQRIERIESIQQAIEASTGSTTGTVPSGQKKPKKIVPFDEPLLDIIQVVDKDPVTGKFECPVQGCRQLFARRYNVKSHYAAKHMDIRRFDCWECGKKFAKNSDVQRHCKAVHKQRSGTWNG